MCINDLPSLLQHCRIHMYADDVQLYLSSPVSVHLNRLNDNSDRMYHWIKANGLSSNPHKSKCMIIRRRTFDSNIVLDILMKGEKIKIVDAARSLFVEIKFNFKNI